MLQSYLPLPSDFDNLSLRIYWNLQDSQQEHIYSKNLVNNRMLQSEIDSSVTYDSKF